MSLVSQDVFAGLCPTTTEIEAISLINAERQKNGLSPLTIDTRLVEAARLHSQDMAMRNYFSHDSLDGSDFIDRIERAGYYWFYASENIAGGYSTPAAAVNAWMNSDGHRANILNSYAKDVGVGYAYGPASEYGHYWTADFGRTCTNCTVTGPCDWADFSATPTYGSAPLSVSFSDRSLVTARSWSWNFGDGTTSTLRNPFHTYSANGAYTVALTITVWGVSDSVVKTGYVYVMSCAAQARVGDEDFGTVQPAYDYAVNHNLDYVDARAKDFQENLMFDSNTSVILRGGFDCDYASNANRYTTVDGTITIGGSGSGAGGLTVENIILR